MKSHHRLMGVNNEPIASKAASEMDDEPMDPNYDDLDDEAEGNNYAVLDLQNYYNREFDPPKTSSHSD